jgi:hypothetical protein
MASMESYREVIGMSKRSRYHLEALDAAEERSMPPSKPRSPSAMPMETFLPFTSPYIPLTNDFGYTPHTGNIHIHIDTMATQLTARYAAPAHGSRTFSSPLLALPPSPITSERTAFLEALQSSVVGLQLEINEFLTKKMEEDNVASGKLAAEEANEEENYGEEVVGDE